MRAVVRLTLLIIVVIPLLAAAVVFLLVLDDQPLISDVSALDTAQVARVERLLREHDPRFLREGEVRTVTIATTDLELMAGYVMRRFANGGVRLVAGDGEMIAVASFAIPRVPVRPYLNIEIGGRQTDGLPAISRLQLGRLPIPAVLANFVYVQIQRAIDRRTDNILSGDFVQRVVLDQQGVAMTYRWRGDVLDVIRDGVIDPSLTASIEASQRRLALLVNSPAVSSPLELPVLLQALLGLALERGHGGDPVQENRAVIIVLEAYVNGRDLALAIPAARNWPRPRNRYVVLAGRQDFARHFMLSSALVAFGDTTLAGMVGLYKELDDSERGSGFSFRDLAADRAGARFGELAVRSSSAAVRLQELAAGGVLADDIMPSVSGLPEFLGAAAFAEQFGNVSDPRYLQMIATIDQRLDALPIYSQ